MNLDEALVLLLEAPAVASKVGARVYAKKLPEGPTYPAIVFHRISAPREHSQDGASGLSHPRYQLNIYAATHQAAQDLAERVRKTIDGWSGIKAGIDINAIFLEDESDGYDDDLKVHWFMQDYTIWHNED